MLKAVRTVQIVDVRTCMLGGPSQSLTSCVSGLLRDSAHVRQSRSRGSRCCPGVTVMTLGLPPDRARGGHDPLIRRSGQVVQDRPSPVVGWADIPESSTCVRYRPAAWQQCWQQSRCCLRCRCDDWRLALCEEAAFFRQLDGAALVLVEAAGVIPVDPKSGNAVQSLYCVPDASARRFAVEVDNGYPRISSTWPFIGNSEQAAESASVHDSILGHSLMLMQ
jgi:hypothetical protein